MGLNTEFQYKFKSNGEIVENIFLKHSAGVTYYLAVGVKGKEERFDPKRMSEYLERFEDSSNSINQDIIKLIKSGYEFKTFWGTTFDGKEFHIEMEDK